MRPRVVVTPRCEFVTPCAVVLRSTQPFWFFRAEQFDLAAVTQVKFAQAPVPPVDHSVPVQDALQAAFSLNAGVPCVAERWRHYSPARPVVVHGLVRQPLRACACLAPAATAKNHPGVPRRLGSLLVVPCLLLGPHHSGADCQVVRGSLQDVPPPCQCPCRPGTR